jgi:3,4-dihydroxy-2-butanone 4-phosphate synthase
MYFEKIFCSGKARDKFIEPGHILRLDATDLTGELGRGHSEVSIITQQ